MRRGVVVVGGGGTEAESEAFFPTSARGESYLALQLPTVTHFLRVCSAPAAVCLPPHLVLPVVIRLAGLLWAETLSPSRSTANSGS